jgi:aspartyl-tRNA(Asn)/glutamyl-tRNA(Gln) amidotransferase subunit A
VIWVTMLSEVYEFHRETLRDRREDYREGLRTRMYMGALVTAADFLRGQRLRARLRREVLALLDRVDALVFPGHAAPAQRFEDVPQTQIIVPGSRYTNVWNLLGLPAIVVPCGFSREGLPVAIQIVGRPFDEPTVLRIARAYERATDWHTRRPDPGRWTL